MYSVNYDIDVTLTKAADKSQIDMFKFPIELDVRHASMNRTWTEVSWLEVGVIALIGGVIFTSYDDKVTSLTLDKASLPVGDYIAQRIVTSINKSKKVSGLTLDPAGAMLVLGSK